MKAGFHSVGNLTQWSTGYMQVARGTTAQRPPVPAPGMFRLNTTTDLYEFFIDGKWVTFLPAKADGTADITIASYQIPNTIGVKSEPMVFVADSTRNNKMLTLNSMPYTWSANYLNNDDWLLLPNVYTSDVGFVMPYDGTITGITSYVAYSQYHSKSLSVWVDNVENKEAHYINGLNTSNATKTTSTNSIDFARGANIRLQARTPENYNGFYMGGIQYVSVAVNVKWRYVP
jgi:hypothetical protein